MRSDPSGQALRDMASHLTRSVRAIVWGRLLYLCVLLVVCGGAAEPAPQPDPHAGPRYEQDAATVKAATQALLTGRAPALATHVAALEDVQGRTPADYREIEETVGEVYYRAANPADFLEFTAWWNARSNTSGTPRKSIVWLDSTYINASFMLGWYFNETRQPDRALAALDRGLNFVPGSGRLVVEKGQALITLRRIDTALALYNTTLSSDGFRPSKQRALLLRAKGFCLTEMKQYDAAEQAYHESLALEPDHAGAHQELAYIARMKNGGTPTPPVMSTYDKLKKNAAPGAAP